MAVKQKKNTKKIDILMIDNYDSFTFNLVQFLGILGENIKVRRNDKIDLDEIEDMAPSKIVISPGPGRPDDAGISKDLIKRFYKQIPILGVCLGHQSIGEVFGAEVINSGTVVHGKVSEVHHDGKTIYKGVDSPFTAARYHSLILKKDTIPPFLKVTAHTTDDIVMGIRHIDYPLEGIQFHPESFLTDNGMRILENFIDL
ncbi:MAG: aminodeoxychorismate/anthranilate synthase component II [Candidatus Humimicrobiaceae bacterium]